MNRINRDRVRLVAVALGKIQCEAVFVGGAVVDLYATNPAAPDPRPTIDVDCIVAVSTLLSMSSGSFGESPSDTAAVV